MKTSHKRIFLLIVVVIVLALIRQAFAAFGVVQLGTGTPVLTAIDLANKLRGDGIAICDGQPGVASPCPSTSTVTYVGDNRAAGTFTGEAAIVGFDAGIVLSTGLANGIIGFFPNPNPSGATSTVLGSSPNGGGCPSGTVLGVPQFKQGLPGDVDLANLAGFATCDATVLEFDFVPNKEKVFLQYVFGSEEYNEFVNTQFNDVFAFFVNGVNCAAVGAPPVPVSINTINNGKAPFTGTPLQGSAPRTNPELFINNDFRTAAPRETQMDGFTVVLTCQASVQPKVLNHIKLAIADGSDATRDSNVLLRAASLTTTPPITIVKKTNGVDHDNGVVPEPLAFIEAGKPVKWTYEVTNSGHDTLTNITVSDNKLGPIACPTTTLLPAQNGSPAESMTCAATGTAVEGRYDNVGTATGTTKVGTTTVIDSVSDHNPDHYFGVQPAISIVTRTNETDNNVAPGPFIRAATPVTWTYTVTNTGDVPLSNVHVADSNPGVVVDCSVAAGGQPKTNLDVGTSMVCSASGIAVAGSFDGAGKAIGYQTIGTATADVSVLDVDGTPYTIHPAPATDVDYYFGADPKIEITAKTDGTDNDLAPGPQVLVNDAVAWTYILKNTGNVPLTDVSVVDDQLSGTICSIPSLAAGAIDTSSCAKSGVAAKGQYTNVGTASGTFSHLRTKGTAEETTFTATGTNPDHYFGAAPQAAVVKKTGTDAINATDNNAAPGPSILVGDPVVWTYLVTNTGNVRLRDLSVTDDKLGFVCQIDTLDAAASAPCTKPGVAQRDQYTNTGTVTGKADTVTSDGQSKVFTTPPASDVDHYFGVAPNIAIVTRTNGTDNNAAAKFVQVGSPVRWTYEVTNTGNVDLHDLTVTDSHDVAVSCPSTPGGGSKTALIVNETMVCSATGTAVAGSYQNAGTAAGKADVLTTGGAKTVTTIASDIDRYFGADPKVTIVTKTDGSDNNSTAGPSVLVDDLVAWTYAVKNVGNVDLTDITVVDDKISGTICSIPALAAGATDTTSCHASAKALKGPYANVGTASAKFGPIEVGGTEETTTLTTDPVSDVDHYFGAAPEIAIVKKTGTNAANTTDNPVEPGPRILVGDPVVWTFDVTNKGNVPLSDVAVTDDKLGSICSIGALAVNETKQCTNPAPATAQRGQQVNTGTASGKTDVVTPDGQSTSVSVTHSDADHYFGVDPKLAIVKKTGTSDANGTDNKTAPGPVILAGDPVVWSFVVTNTGNVPLTGVTIADDKVTVGPDCTIGALAVDESRSCKVTGTAQRDQHHNTATATGQADVLTVDGPRTVTKTASDDDYYFGAAPEIKIVKLTGTDSSNGTDNNTAPGAVILAGDPVVWTYVVTNSGNVALTGVAVTDDKVAVGADCAIGPLAAGETRSCHATGTAQRDQHQNTATATGKADVLTVDGAKTVLKTASDVDYYFGAAPEIKVVKKTGPTASSATDNPVAPGPLFLVGDPVVWTYLVTNTGNVPLTDVAVTDDKISVGPDCRIGTLAAGESRACYATGTAQRDQHENTGTATGRADVLTATGPRTIIKTATDLDHYFGADPRIGIVKKTNGIDSDLAPGPFVLVDDIDTWTRGEGPDRAPLTCGHPEEHAKDPASWSPAHKKEHSKEPQTWIHSKEQVRDLVTWTYVVTNTGNVPLRDVAITDDKVGAICTIGSLAAGATTTCTSSGNAVKGQYENTGIASGKSDVVTVTGARTVTVTDRNVDHYFGAAPKVSIVKMTNGTNNDWAPGPSLLVGGNVTWTYVVTNTGNVPLANLVVTDDKAGPVCTIASLAAGAGTSCMKTSPVQKGPYENVGTVVARVDTVTASGQIKTVTVTASNVEHYFGALPALAIVKRTNGTNNNSAPGPIIKVGQTVTWTYEVTNIGNVPLTHLIVSDNTGVAVSCSGLQTSPSSYGKFEQDDKNDDQWNDGNWSHDGKDDDYRKYDDHGRDDDRRGDDREKSDGNTQHRGSNQLPVGATIICSASGRAVAGQYLNVGTATATAPVGPPVTASDVDYYFGAKTQKEPEKNGRRDEKKNW